MTDFRIVCTNQEPKDEPISHAHIVEVGIDTDGDGYADERHSLQYVVRAIDNGTARYYTYGARSNKIAWVETLNCPTHCGERIIRSKGDAVLDNNLDKMRRCKWN